MVRVIRYPRIALGVFGAILAGFLLYNFFPTGSVEALAEESVRYCADAEEKSLCYEKHVPELMDTGITMEEAFEIVREIQELDPDYVSCHVLAHNISAKETAKDPSKWKDVVARAPYGICGNGSSHGAFQERFRTDAWPDASLKEIVAELKGTCDARDSWNPSRSEISNCMHGIGHLAMFVTNADVEKSAAVCDAVAITPAGDHRQTCYEGIFMQVFQPLEDEDKSLVEKIAPKPEARLAYCNTFEGLVRSICVRESWILVPEYIATTEGFSSHCAPIQNPEEYIYCVQGIAIGVFSTVFEFDVSRMMGFCAELDSELNRECVAMTAFRLVQTDWRNIDDAIGVCDRAGEVRDHCYSMLISYGFDAFLADSPEGRALCGGMPMPWRDECESTLPVL